MVRVVVTGVDGLVGRTVAGLLAGRGDEVVGLCRRRPHEPPEGVRLVEGGIAAGAEAMSGADVAVHCANESADAVTAAAEGAGIRRLIRLAPLHRFGVDRAVSPSASQIVVVRPGVVLGRGIEDPLRSLLAAQSIPALAGVEHPWAIIHHDDVARFIVMAVDSDLTGEVDLAVAEPVGIATVAAALGRTVRRISPSALGRLARERGLPAAEMESLLRCPPADTAALHRRWGFEPAWSAAETLADTRLAVTGMTARAGSVRRIRGRAEYRHQIIPADTPPGDGAPLSYSGPERLRGEFDTPIDVRFPVYSQTNLAEALPGPSTALTLEVQGRGLRGTTEAVADILRFPGPLDTEARARLQAVHAHRVYINGSGAYHVSLAMPGTNPEAMAEQFTGTHADELPGGFAAVAGTYAPPRQSPVAKARALIHAGAEIIGLIRRAELDVAEVRTQTARLEDYCDDLAALSPGRLEVLLLLAKDLLCYAWTVQGVVNLVGGAVLELASKTGGSDAGHSDDLESGAALRGVRQLAARAAADPRVIELLADRSPGLPDRVASGAPEFFSDVQRALDRFGHRGPGEGELDARGFADDVHGFLSTVGRAAAAGRTADAERDGEGHNRNWAQRLAFRLLAVREQNRDRVVRLTWLTRRLVLEQGRRLVAQGRLDEERDVFHLTVAQIIDPPADAKEIVARRRRERSRLAGLQMPPIFLGKWESADVLPPLRAGESITGIGICKGTVVGRARVVDADTIDDLEPGEIMIAHVTDVGYTALFGHCGAVVTDIGGVMSHAAVVAREYGVPCVVDTQVAATRIPTGTLVQVDGETGVVTVLETADDAVVR